MDNQHRQIKGYRELSREEIDLMNAVKAKGVELKEILERVDAFLTKDNAEHRTPDAESRRWLSIGKTHLQQGLMAVTRSVARPDLF